MLKFFKPEDFEASKNYPPEMQYTAVWAAIANAKLEREGKVVYGNDNKATWTNHWSSHESEKWKEQRALLINIEPIEKCAHPVEMITANDPKVIHGFLCAKCGIKIKSKGFEEVK